MANTIKNYTKFWGHKVVENGRDTMLAFVADVLVSKKTFRDIRTVGQNQTPVLAFGVPLYNCGKSVEWLTGHSFEANQDGMFWATANIWGQDQIDRFQKFFANKDVAKMALDCRVSLDSWTDRNGTTRPTLNLNVNGWTGAAIKSSQGQSAAPGQSPAAAQPAQPTAQPNPYQKAVQEAQMFNLDEEDDDLPF